MKYFESKEFSLKTLGASCCLLRDALKTQNLKLKAEKVSVALKGIEMFLRKNPDVECPYYDILKSELTPLLKKEIPYIDGFTGKTKTVPFCKLEQVCKKITYNNTKKTTANFPQDYKIINRAIGKIKVNGKEAYSVLLAVEHSLESTILRWISECSKYEGMI